MPNEEQQTQNGENGNQVSTYSVKLPQFWPTAPEAYFELIEASFRTGRVISQSRTKYDYLIQALPSHVALEVLDVMRKCRESQTPYEDMKKELISRNSMSESSRIEQLLSGTQMGDRTPSAFYRHMLNVAGTTVDEKMVRTLWMRRLPQLLEVSLRPFDSESMDTVLKIADQVFEVQQRQQSVSSVNPSTSCDPYYEGLKNEISELRKIISEMKPSGSQGRRSRSQSRNRSSNKGTDSNLCYFHEKFGDAARKCKGAPCPKAPSNSKN